MNQEDAFTPARLPVYWHPDIALHDLAAKHVAMHEQRLGLVADHLLVQPWAKPVQVELDEAEVRQALERVHHPDYLETLRSSEELIPGRHLAFDDETRLNCYSWRTLTLSASSWLHATRAAVRNEHLAAFCVGYAGHHARYAGAAGFCFVNGVAVAAKEALALGLSRVAVLDFDTHAGDGTVLALLDEPRAFFAETYQPGFPGRFMPREHRSGIERLLTSDAYDFRPNWDHLLEQVSSFQPQLVLVSAGFDAHQDDPLSQIGVDDEAYAWLGQKLAALPCPVVCGLEGGYNLNSTRRAAALFCEALAAKR